MKTFEVEYSTKDIMDKLEEIHGQITYTNGTVKLHTKLIWGAYGFTMSAILCLLAYI